MKISQKSIDKISNYFQDKPILKAYLFGSQIREDARAESDVDILVELDYEQKIGLLFVEMQMELEELLQKKVDLVTTNGISKYIEPIIKNERELIYER